MKLVTASKMQEIDHQAVNTYGIPSMLLMEHAGHQVVQEMATFFPTLQQKQVLILCGKGNNGGDGLVVARHLFNRSISVQVVLLTRSTEFPTDIATNLQICANLQIPVIKLFSISHVKMLDKLMNNADVIVDGILGTGLNSDLEPFLHAVVTKVNESAAQVVSIDIPTGLSATSGQVLGVAVQADLTVTFALAKIGHCCLPSRSLVGKLSVVDIGIPPLIYENDHSLNVDLLTKEVIAQWMPKRCSDAHKGLFGHTLVVAGCRGMSGAAVMTALGAYRAGSGKVTVAVPKSILSQVATQLPEIMVESLPETKKGAISEEAISRLLDLAKNKSVMVIGPGLSLGPEVTSLLDRLITQIDIPVVIDADGINAIRLPALKYAKVPIILTPHPKEMATLLHKSVSSVQKQRLEVTKKAAETHQCFIVLKGSYTIIATPQGYCALNPTGNPGMATAGSGDVLAGMIAGMLARGLAPYQAAAVSVYLHGKAGEFAAEQLGEEYMMATDLLKMLPQAYRASGIR